MAKGRNKVFGLRGKKERGYTLLEYAVGAAVIMGIVITGLSGMAGQINSLFGAIGNWAAGQAGNINPNP